MRLEWAPPLDDGGANVTSYQIFVDGSIEVTTNVTVAVIVLNSTDSEEHLVQVRAMNCAGYGANASRNVTGSNVHKINSLA